MPEATITNHREEVGMKPIKEKSSKYLKSYQFIMAIGLWVYFSKKKVLHFRAMSRSIDLGHRCCKEIPRSCEEQTMA